MGSPMYARGRLCPRCGKPLIWLGEWHGDRYVPKAREVKLSTRISERDRPVPVEVSRTGLEVRTRTAWMHRVELECKWCSRLFSEDQAVRGEPEGDKVPGDY